MKTNELYNIYDLVSFELINNTGNLILGNFNPEYKFFQSSRRTDNHFKIIVHNKKDNYFKKLRNNKRFWSIDIDTYFEKGVLNVFSENIGIKNYFSYIIFKNIYVRSLISLQLLNKNATLVHSCAFKINNKTYIIAGRPGVFKTSILMDAIRNYDAEFIGEENCLINNSKVYPFPLNIDSISYKIRFFSNENASSKMQKVKLGINILRNFRNSKHYIKISDPCKINNLIFLVKGNKFSIRKTNLNEILPYLIDNEFQELNIPPTHSLSGINNNYLRETIEEEELNKLYNFKENLEKVFKKNLADVNLYIAISPQTYKKQYTNNLIDNL